MSKICSKCKVGKSDDDFNNDKSSFDGKYCQCKACCRLRRSLDKSKANVRAAKYRNQPHVKERNKKYQLQYRKTDVGKEVYRKAIRKYRKNKYDSDIEYRLIHIQRQRISDVLKGACRSKKTLDLIGCSPKALKEHLESQFTSDMNWDNYGSYWQVDHKYPLSVALKEKDGKFDQCCHYTNLQPLTIKENQIKSNKLLPEYI